MDDVCSRCRFGRIRTTTACFIGNLDGYPLVVPTIPAYSCDICGWIEYDADVLWALDNLIQQPDLPFEIALSKGKHKDSISARVSVN